MRRARKRKEQQHPVTGEEALEEVRDETRGPGLIPKGPRQSLEGEQATLGAMFVEREAITRSLRCELEARDFYSPQHAQIAEVIFDLFRRDEPVDIVTLAEELRHRDLLERVGGMSYLTELQNSAPTAAAVAHYAKIVRRHSVARIQCLAADSYANMLRREKEEEDNGLHLAALLQSLELGVDSRLDVISAEDLLAQEITVDWLVKPIIPLGGETLLYGAKGLGKSLLSLSLCHALASGFGSWLGHYHIPKGWGALYVDGEVGRAGTRERLLDLDLALGYPPAPPQEIQWWEEEPEVAENGHRPLGFIFPKEPGSPRFDLGPTFTGALERHIRDWHAKVVVLDSLMRLKPPNISINRADDAALVTDRIRRLAIRTNCAIILIHHQRKWQQGLPEGASDEAVGSVDWGNAADSVLRVMGEPQGVHLLLHEKPRLGRIEPTFRFTTASSERGEGQMLFYDGVQHEDAGIGIDRAQEAILAQLGTGPTMRQELLAIAREVAEVRGRQANRALSLLTGQGKVEKRKVGAHNEMEYRLKETPQNDP